MIKCSYCNFYFHYNWIYDWSIETNNYKSNINNFNQSICDSCYIIVKERQKFNIYLRFNILRKFVKLRSICIFWLKITCENIYAPGKIGFQRDIIEFNKFINNLSNNNLKV